MLTANEFCFREWVRMKDIEREAKNEKKNKKAILYTQKNEVDSWKSTAV